MSFQPLAHPLIFSQPHRTTDVYAWHEHIPLAFYVVSELRPRLLVELGTHKGDSYCAFCQAVQALALPTSCYAIDTWEGDDHSLRYGPEVLEELRAYHDPRYGSFSTLVQQSFDEAVAQFSDSSVDVLHIDGYHTYDAVKHDFDTWLPKLSDRGVVLFHDTNVRERDFGVWRLWDELSSQYPSVAFAHGLGMGILAVGPHVDPAFLAFMTEVRNDPTIAMLFFALGDRVAAVSRERRTQAALDAGLERQRELELELDEARRRDAERATEVDELRRELDELRRGLEELGREKQTAIETLEDELVSVRNSISWRVTAPLRGAKRLASKAESLRDRRSAFVFAEDVESAVSEAECSRLADLARGKRVLEVGSWFGRSAIAMASAGATVTAVDPHDLGPAGQADTLNPMIENLERYGVRDRVDIRKGFSEEVLPTLEPESFDLAFIDANHSADEVRHDFELVRPLVRPGGLVAFHDYGPAGIWLNGTWFDWGVTEVVDELAARYSSPVDVVDTLATISLPEDGGLSRV